ncbi:hypothetical protein EDD94_5565 [Streptomyces sp. PanSC9]|nr:hypothetical protein EDD94_5565 [Streptomyces sp. PanSC9]
MEGAEGTSLPGEGGEVASPGASGAPVEEEADGDGLPDELLDDADGVGGESAHAAVVMKVATIAVAAAKLCLSLTFPPAS